MARIYLYPGSGDGSGARFTPAGVAELSASFRPVSELDQFSSEREADGLILRAAESQDRRLVRTIAYQSDPLSTISRSATEWWERFTVANTGSYDPSLHRDVITGELTVDQGSISPTGSVSSFVRYGALTADGAPLVPSFAVEGVNWSAADLLAARSADLHSFLTSGNDVVVGSSLNDQINVGPGLNNLYGAEGSDYFLLTVGRPGVWMSHKTKDRGVLIGQRSGSSRKRFLYDADLNIVRDFQPGDDILALASKPSSFTYVDDKLGTLVFTSASKRNLVAIVEGARGLDAFDFQQI
jgi:hypothetical protein